MAKAQVQEPQQHPAHAILMGAEGQLAGIVIGDEAGRVVDRLSLQRKVFKTGSRGFYAFGKINFDGKKYQVSCNIVEVHSQPN